MILVESVHVGQPALARLSRDGIVIPFGHGRCLAADVTPSPGMRAASFATCVVRGAALTGAAALWVHGCAEGEPPPRWVDVAVPRGSNPDAPVACRHHGWRYITDSVAVRTAVVMGGVPVVALEAALATAFAHDPWGHGVRAAHWASRRGANLDEVAAALARQAPSERRARALTAWATVAAALPAV